MLCGARSRLLFEQAIDLRQKFFLFFLVDFAGGLTGIPSVCRPNAAGVLNTLLERHLIKIVGRKQVVGRPFLYATTKEFLIRFGLNDLNDLPKVEDMAEALGIEAPILVERPLEEEQLPLEEPEADVETDDEPSRGGSSGSVH